MTGIPDNAVLNNILEAYDIPNDFPKDKHEQKSHANKVIQHFL